MRAVAGDSELYSHFSVARVRARRCAHRHAAGHGRPGLVHRALWGMWLTALRRPQLRRDARACAGCRSQDAVATGCQTQCWWCCNEMEMEFWQISKSLLGMRCRPYRTLISISIRIMPQVSATVKYNLSLISTNPTHANLAAGCQPVFAWPMDPRVGVARRAAVLCHNSARACSALAVSCDRTANTGMACASARILLL